MITTYTELQTAMTEWLARDQDTTLTARIPTFIQMFEGKMNRNLFVRQMEQRSTTVTSIVASEPEMLDLPSDFQSMRRVRLSSVSGKPRLEFKSGAQMDEYRASIGNTSGQPLFFTIFGNEIELGPTPDGNYTVEMVYRKNIPALSSNSTNWLLTLAPDLYLYGSLMETAPYIQQDDRLNTWGPLYSTALSDLNSLGMMSTFNSGPIAMRISGVTP